MVLHVYNHINQKQTLLRNGVVFLEMWDKKNTKHFKSILYMSQLIC